MYYYKASGKRGQLQRSCDEALCFGLIDGVRLAIDEETFKQRFTPRTKKVSGAVNIKRIAELTAEGRMHASGISVSKSRSQT